MIAGVDVSTRYIDLVAFDPDEPTKPERFRVEMNGPSWWQSCREMSSTFHLQGLYAWAYEREIHLFGVERPYGPSRQAIAALHAVLGAVVATLPVRATVLDITPAQMRQELGLPGTAEKGRLQIAVFETLGGTPPIHFAANRCTSPGTTYGWPPDAFDAWAVAWATMRICERGTPVPREEDEET